MTSLVTTQFSSESALQEESCAPVCVGGCGCVGVCGCEYKIIMCSLYQGCIQDFGSGGANWGNEKCRWGEVIRNYMPINESDRS